MGLVEGVLNFPAALRLLDGRFHGRRFVVGIHDDLAVGISGRTADGLDETGLGSEEAFFVRIQNSHQTDLRQVQALPQQVDTHQHVEFCQP